jgi:hypothetical protein
MVSERLNVHRKMCISVHALLQRAPRPPRESVTYLRTSVNVVKRDWEAEGMIHEIED